MRQRTGLEHQIGAVREIETALQDLEDFATLAAEEGDDAVIDDVLVDIRKLQARADRAQVEALLSGEADSNDAYLQVNAGAGGTEAQDWVEMILRMYLRW